MSARPQSRFLGKGTFGVVEIRNGKAVKRFKRLEDLLQEIIVTKYMNDSKYTVKLLGYSLENLTMETELWDSSLKDIMEKQPRDIFTYDQRKKIFQRLLIGLTHLHTRLIIHSDFKPSNIFVNIKTGDVCIGDMGLSSTTKYAKVKQTAPAYSHKIVVPITLHDMFGLAMTMMEFLSNYKIRSRVTPERLRYHIKQKIPDLDIQNILLAMCPNDPTKAITSRDALERLFGMVEDAEIHVPEARVFDSKILEEDLEWVKSRFTKAMTKARINRDARCFFAFSLYVNNPDNPEVDAESYPLYMSAFMIIFAAVFGEFGFGLREAKMALSEKYYDRSIYQALRNILSDTNVINFIMMPDLRKSEY